jgi:hypothetical protein
LFLSGVIEKMSGRLTESLKPPLKLTMNKVWPVPLQTIARCATAAAADLQSGAGQVWLTKIRFGCGLFG